MIPKKVICVFGTVLFLFGYCCSLNAQTTVTDAVVSSFFSKPKKIQWIEHYRGKIDGANAISAALAYDGKSCKGLLKYKKSGERFRLDGVLNGNELMLLEVDQNGAITGQFDGFIEGKNIHLSWSNFDNTIGSELHLSQVQDNKRGTSSRKTGNWVNYYQGNIFESKVEFYLQKDGQNNLKGIVYFEGENKSYDLSGELFDFDNLKIVIKDNKHKVKGTIEGIFEGEHNISANYFSSEGQRFPMYLQNAVSLKLACKEFADYVIKYDVSFPKTRSISFNRWMDNLTSQWMDICRNQAYEARMANNVRKPETRASIRAYAWSDVDYFDQQIISGSLTYENTWTEGTGARSFNFDFRTGKEITLDDIFIEEFAYVAFVIDFLNKEIDQHSYYSDYAFRKWLSEQGFPYFFIHKDGLIFCTPFDSVYGRQKVKIPYESLSPYFKENNVLEYLINVQEGWLEEETNSKNVQKKINNK